MGAGEGRDIELIVLSNILKSCTCSKGNALCQL